MLKIEEIEGGAVHVVSDDANAENVALDEAVNLAAPHLYDDFAATEMDDEGLLKWRVQPSDYESLLEVLDALENVNPADVEAASLLVEAKSKEVSE